MHAMKEGKPKQSKPKQTKANQSKPRKLIKETYRENQAMYIYTATPLLFQPPGPLHAYIHSPMATQTDTAMAQNVEA